MSELHLVTGGSGYFGSLLVRHLVEAGHNVRILDLNDSDDRPVAVDLVQADIRDPAAVRKACEGVTVVHHNVALVPLAKDRRAFWSVNLDGTHNILEAALQSGVRKFMQTSSSAVFGVPPRNPVDDAVAPNPLEDYGRAKLAAENKCHEYVEKGLDVTIIRPRTIMGHGRLGIMQSIFEWVRKGQNVPVLGDGENIYQFVHADDLATAVIKAARIPGANTFNIGAARFGTMRATLESLVRHAGTGSRVVSLPRRSAESLMKLTGQLGLSPLGPYHWIMYGESMYFDITRPMRELTWEPRYSNEEMFCESYDWYLQHRETLLSQVTHASPHRSPIRSSVLNLVGWGLRWF